MLTSDRQRMKIIYRWNAQRKCYFECVTLNRCTPKAWFSQWQPRSILCRTDRKLFSPPIWYAMSRMLAQRAYCSFNALRFGFGPRREVTIKVVCTSPAQIVFDPQTRTVQLTRRQIETSFILQFRLGSAAGAV